MAIPDAAFSAVRFCSYTARRTCICSMIGLLRDSCSVRFMLFKKDVWNGIDAIEQKFP